MKRVLLIINSDLIAAGVPGVVMTIVRNLHEKFIFDIVTYHNAAGIYDAEFRSYGGEIYHLELMDYNKHKFLFWCRAFQITSFMNSLLSQKKYDVIHCHNGIESGIFLQIAKKHNIPVRIAHAHGTYYRSGKNKILLAYNKHFLNLIARYATKRLACSTLSGDSLFGKSDYENILNPIDGKYYQSVEKKEHGGLNLLQIGYYCNNKNQLFTLHLFEVIKDIYPDAELYFVGFEQEPEYWDRMNNVVREKQLLDSVHFMPSDADKKKLLAVADCVLLPSFSEGLPLVALEAQSSRTPCIISDRVCADADIGLAFFADVNDIEEWVTLIKQILADDVAKSAAIDLNKVDAFFWCKHIVGIYYGNTKI